MARLMKQFATIVLMLGFASTALAAAGYVHEVTGSATVRSGNAAARALKVGDLVEQGDTIATGAGASAIVKFEDGQVMVMHENTEFAVQRYNFNKQKVADSNAIFSMARGGLRFISGMIASTNKDNFRINAGTSVIGVRGTDGTLVMDAITQIVTAAVNDGALAVSNGLGNAGVTVGNPASSGPNLAPGAASQAVLDAVSQTLNTLSAKQNIPINTPTVAATAGRAAAAQAAANQARAAAAASPGDANLQKQAADATLEANAALTAAVTAAQQAYQDAVKAGGVPPAPGVGPSSSSSSSTIGSSGASGQSTSGTTGTTSGSGSGSGGGGGGSTGGGTASPN